MKKTLNITNGETLKNHFLNKHNIESIAFNEAMMSYDTINNIFSDEFIEFRSKQLNVNKDLYVSKLKEIIGLKDNCNQYQEINLYFGLDTFCQINLLTMLAFLEQINYQNDIYLNIVDDYSNEILEKNIKINLNGYLNLYNEILINSNKINELKVINKQAIDLYFDYLSEDGKLALLVKENNDKSNEELLILLLINSKDYGLSDLQAKALIKKYKK